MCKLISSMISPILSCAEIWTVNPNRGINSWDDHGYYHQIFHAEEDSKADINSLICVAKKKCIVMLPIHPVTRPYHMRKNSAHRFFYSEQNIDSQMNRLLGEEFANLTFRAIQWLKNWWALALGLVYAKNFDCYSTLEFSPFRNFKIKICAFLYSNWTLSIST